MGDRQVPLPLRIAAAARGEALTDGESGTIGREGFVELALRQQHVAHAVVRDRDIPLPLRIGRIEVGNAFRDGEILSIGSKRLIELALSQQRVGELAV